MQLHYKEQILVVHSVLDLGVRETIFLQVSLWAQEQMSPNVQLI